MTLEKKLNLPTSLQTITVLYVEDDPDIRTLLTPFLEKRVGELMVATNGLRGIQLFKERRPDLVITDILMPIMDGLAMCRIIRKMDDDTPIILTTAHNDEKSFLQAIDLGVDRFVVKPTHPPILLAAVEKCAQLIWRKREQAAANAYIRFLLDAQPTLLLVISENHLEYINRAFLRFLGFPSITAFKKNHPEIGQLMVTREGKPLAQINNGAWIECLLKDPKAFSIIYLRRPGAPASQITPFAVTFNTLPEQDKHLFSFSDITHIEDEKKQLEIQASTDALTGTCNRAGLQGILNAEIRRAQRHNLPFSIILADIDHFKKVNDTHGHQVGDDVLKLAARLMRENIRAEAIAARWGGEEFMIVSPQGDLQQTRALAEKLRSLIETTAFPEVETLTCSFGVAQMAPGDSIRTLTERADKALYLAKSSGRNRVETAPTNQTPA